MDRSGETEPEGGSVKERTIRSARLLALFGLGCVLFNYPILAIFNVPAFIRDIPILYVYVFCAWLFLIVLIALASRESSPSEDRSVRPPLIPR
jgi:hypothetical protein